MILPLLAAALLRTEGEATRVLVSPLAPKAGAAPRLQTWYRDEPLNRTKLSPKLFGPTKEPFTFDWLVAGFATLPPNPEQWVLRFRVYNQTKPKAADETFGAARMLLRLWEVADAWGIDHPKDIPGGAIDVYLCWGGKPGGEQLTDHDPQIPAGLPDKVSTIYVYDLPSFTAPVERAREVAHEYGHAVLPAVGGYSAPEFWGNGVLGERLFLAALAQDAAAGNVPPADLFGLAPGDLDAWVAANVAPARNRAALGGPFAPLYAARTKAGMDAFVGEATLLAAVLPPKTFGRALRLMETQSPAALVKSAPLALAESPAVPVRLPADLVGKPVWLPLGAGSADGAKVLARKNGWAKIVSARPDLTIRTGAKG